MGSRDPWFRIGGRVPLLGASARPSGMLYARLLGRKWKQLPTPFHLPNIPSAIPDPRLDLAALSAPRRERVERLCSGLLKARQAGIRLLLVRYPASPMDRKQLDEMEAAIRWLHQQTGAAYLDLESQIPASELVFTDGVHLGPASAARVLVTIREAIRKLEQEGH